MACMYIYVHIYIYIYIYILLLLFFFYLFTSFFTEILDLIYSWVTIYYGKTFLFIFNKAICIFRFIIMKKKLPRKKNIKGTGY